MPDISFKYSNPATTGIDVPAAGFIRASLLNREIVDGGIRTTDTFDTFLVGGETVITLSPTGPNQCWEVKESNSIDRATTRFVTVGDTDTPFVDLPDVDPATMLPLPNLAPSVAELIDEVRSIAAGVSNQTVTAIDNPDGSPTLLLTFPTFMLDPEDSNALVLTVG